MYLNIAAVCVLYNPILEEVMENITSYLNSVDKVYIVDNSDKHIVNESDFLYNNRLVYINNGKNLGIAKALNIAAYLAIEGGYEWLLTMDQDSKAYPNMLTYMMEYINKIDVEHIGIVAAQPDSIRRHSMRTDGITFMDTVITSGNLVNLIAYKKVGGYVDELFIDYVDHFFCLSLREKGFSIVQVNKALLNHHLGNSKGKYVGNLKLVITHHNFIRRYYITRNRFYLYKKFWYKYPFFVFADFLRFFKELFFILMYEQDKKKKMKSIIGGLVDCYNNNFGCKK